MRVFIAAMLVSLSVFETPHADETPSVLVQTEIPRLGTLPDVLSVYGSAMPALNGGMTLSVQQEGRVSAIAVTPGEKVRAGQKLLDFSASAAASSTYEQAVSALALARGQRAHAAQLLRQQLATRDQLAQADKGVSDAQSTLDALRREGAGQPVRGLDAPFDGIVETIPVAQGDRIQSGATLITLVRLDGLVVTVGVEPGERSRLRPGEAARLVPLSGGEAIDGHVLRVDAMLNPKTRLVDADIAVPVDKVMSGEAFRVDVTTGQLQGWVVPHDAVLTDDKGTYVFQIADGKATRVDVTLVGGRDGQDVVTGPLNAARKLVVQGNYQLDTGTAVRESGEAAQVPVPGSHE